jgi:agmatine deiminase
MPAEWERHEATWLGWPHERSDWPGKFAPIPWVYTEIIRHLIPGERVRILVRSAQEQQLASSMLRKVGADLRRVDFFKAPTNRSWVRDYGPIFIKRGDGEVAIANWKFNGWAKYQNYQLDDRVVDRLARALKARQWKPTIRSGSRERRIALEGGSIDVNGAGTLLTTEECLLSPIQARNPGISKEELEWAFSSYLGVRKVLWLHQGIAGDDTHGHVDDIARFVDPRTVVLAVEEDESDSNAPKLKANRALLESMSDQDGQPLRLALLPMPKPIYFDGQRLPASYANFYIANAAVLVPTFNDPKDRIALQVLGDLFPSREVVGIHSVDLVLGLGTLHCMTQQQPAQQKE